MCQQYFQRFIGIHFYSYFHEMKIRSKPQNGSLHIIRMDGGKIPNKALNSNRLYGKTKINMGGLSKWDSANIGYIGTEDSWRKERMKETFIGGKGPEWDIIVPRCFYITSAWNEFQLPLAYMIIFLYFG